MDPNSTTPTLPTASIAITPAGRKMEAGKPDFFSDNWALAQNRYRKGRQVWPDRQKRKPAEETQFCHAV